MNELLKINYETEQPTVSARDLHEQLHIDTPSALDVDISVLLKTEADSNEAGDKQREKERPDVRAFVKLLKIEDGYAVCDVRFKVVKPDEEQEVTDH